jgi:hypothetical protein
MESNWAAENLQTIRTLMERSAVYRRALAPVTTYVGIVGIAGAGTGEFLKIANGGVFTVYWMAISLVAIAGAFLLVRRQALKSGESFWSPPTRRIAKAMLPGLLVGFAFGVIAAISSVHYPESAEHLIWLVAIWCLLYGLALNAAGFFMPRGIKLFAWFFIIAGLWLSLEVADLGPLRQVTDILQAGALSRHFLMGILFGLSHLAYGIYLYFTEPRKNESLS